MTYTGIKFQNTSGGTQQYIKIKDGVHKILDVANNTDIQVTNDAGALESPATSVLFLTVSVDTTANVVSGYDAAGTRYLVEQGLTMTTTLA